MKKNYFLLLATVFVSQLMAQSVCNQNGNVIIYSNYDGGSIHINVDQNIPNLKIGIVSYEAALITISGTYSANVTEVRYAGYNASDNNCGNVTNTSIVSDPSTADSIFQYPSAGYPNPNGYPSIICNYSCDSATNQGGCNTPDQIVHYFVTVFGGQLYYHYTQYGCWSNNTYSVSAGGNCCIAQHTTGINRVSTQQLTVFPSPANKQINVIVNGTQEEFVLLDILGNKIASGKGSLETASLPGGFYFVQVKTISGVLTKKVVVQH